jgi:hypothetical protein
VICRYLKYKPKIEPRVEPGDVSWYDLDIEKRRATNTTPQTVKDSWHCYLIKDRKLSPSLLAVFLFVHKFDEFDHQPNQI